MKINLFSCILTLLAITSVAKFGTLVDRLRFHNAQYQSDTSASFFINVANAKEAGTAIPKPSEAKGLEKIEKEKSSTPQPESRDTPSTPPSTDNLLSLKLNGDEIRLLKELSKRREVLDKHEQQLNLRESMLRATEDKLEQKMGELRVLQDKVNIMLNQYQDKENMRIRSLAKIYENMKPKEAAKIFDELEMPILFDIVKNMKEAKVAPIIANMNPIKAKDISLEFTKQDITNAPKIQ